MALTWSSSSHKEFFIYLSAQFMPCNVIYKTLPNMDSVYSAVNTYYSFCEAVCLTSSRSFSTIACACIASHTKTFFPSSSFLLTTGLIHLWDFFKDLIPFPFYNYLMKWVILKLVTELKLNSWDLNSTTIASKPVTHGLDQQYQIMFYYCKTTA